MTEKCSRDQSGFTLVELLVAISILGVIMTALAAAFIVGLKMFDSTTTRVSLSHDIQLASSYWVPDAQTADDVSVTDTTCLPSGGTLLVRFAHTPRVASGPTPADVFVSYAVVNAAGEKRVVRQNCQGGTTLGQVVVAHNVGAATPAVTCTKSDGTSMSCPSTILNPQPAGVSLTIGDSATVGTSTVQLTIPAQSSRRSTP